MNSCTALMVSASQVDGELILGVALTEVVDAITPCVTKRREKIQGVDAPCCHRCFVKAVAELVAELVDHDGWNTTHSEDCTDACLGGLPCA